MHVPYLPTVYNSSSRASDVLFCSPWAADTHMVHTQAYQQNTYKKMFISGQLGLRSKENNLQPILPITSLVNSSLAAASWPELK